MDVLYFLFNRGYTDMTELHQLLLRYKYDGSDPVAVLNTICHTRNIQYGKGERDLSYRMLITLFSVFPDVAIDTLRHLISTDGGLNDVKYFCLFVEKEGADCEPLVSTAVSLANSALRSHNAYAGKWIPREKKSNIELYDRFVRDWFGTSFVTSRMRQEYRYIVSGLSSAGLSSSSGRSCRNQFIGEYFKAGLRGESISSIAWSGLMGRLGNCCHDSIPVVDIDIEIAAENLYHALGFACLIAQKSKSWRVLLISGEPIWVDLTAASGDFCAMASLLWEHCEMRTRSRFSLGLDLIYNAPSENLRLFFFSETFAFDWFDVAKKLGSVVFWNIGNRAIVPTDFYTDDYPSCVLMSGYMPGLVTSVAPLAVLDSVPY